MESTKAALESERKIQMLQMQAINALWKKVSAIQPEGGDSNNAIGSSKPPTTINNSELVKDLAQTCSVLQNQVMSIINRLLDTDFNFNYLDSTTSRIYAGYRKIYVDV